MCIPQYTPREGLLPAHSIALGWEPDTGARGEDYNSFFFKVPVALKVGSLPMECLDNYLFLSFESDFILSWDKLSVQGL